MMTCNMLPLFSPIANVFWIPVARPALASSIVPQPQIYNNKTLTAVAASPSKRKFSSSSILAARKVDKAPRDKRITLIRYFLSHPITPRPLRFSRNRYLRHWTIHRAWQLYRRKQESARVLELQRQWASMQAACEELRTGAGDGGKLFRVSMNKKGIFTDQIPIEYGRLQTESPSRDGWNYDWKRSE